MTIDFLFYCQATELRLDEDYVRWYSCIINSIVMIVIPTFVLIFTTYKVKMLLNSTPPGSLSDERSKARAKRNKSITRMLIGIIVMFLICHTGKVCIMQASFYFKIQLSLKALKMSTFQIVISFYEVFLMLFHESAPFEPWAKHLIVINSLLCTINSSCNFAFYCGDVVFRQCLSAVSRSGLSKFNLKKCCKNSQVDDDMLEMEEVTLKASPQHKISRSPSSNKKVFYQISNFLFLRAEEEVVVVFGICTVSFSF